MSAARANLLRLLVAFVAWGIPGLFKGTIRHGEDAWIFLWLIPWLLLGFAVMAATVRLWIVEGREP